MKKQNEKLVITVMAVCLILLSWAVWKGLEVGAVEGDHILVPIAAGENTSSAASFLPESGAIAAEDSDPESDAASDDVKSDDSASDNVESDDAESHDVKSDDIESDDVESDDVESDDAESDTDFDEESDTDEIEEEPLTIVEPIDDPIPTKAPEAAVEADPIPTKAPEAAVEANPTPAPEEDHSYPVLTIDGVRDRSANREALRISITLEDEHLEPDGLSVRLTGTRQGDINLPTPILTNGTLSLNLPEVNEDDYYILDVTGRDSFGNQVHRSLSFSENQRGAVIETADRTLEDSSRSEAVTPAFVVSDLDEMTILSASVNGREVAYDYRDGQVVLKEELKEEGSYEVILKTRDSAGHEADTRPLRFSIDKTKPIVIIEGENRDQAVYDAPFFVRVGRDLAEDSFAEITLDGCVIVKDDRVTPDGAELVEHPGDAIGQNVHIKISGEGEHTVTAQAVDRAGNRSEIVSKTFLLKPSEKRKNSGISRIIAVILGTVATIGASFAGISVYFRKKSRKDE